MAAVDGNRTVVSQTITKEGISMCNIPLYSCAIMLWVAALSMLLVALFVFVIAQLRDIKRRVSVLEEKWLSCVLESKARSKYPLHHQ